MVPLPSLSGSPTLTRSGERCSGFARSGGEIAGYRSGIHAYLRRRGFSGEDAEDLTQETLIRGYLHLGDFQGGNLGGWLYRIAGNLAIDHRRRQRRHPILSLETARFQPSAAGNPESALLSEIYDRELGIHLEALTPEQRELIRLRFQETRSVQEIAERLNCTTGAAKLRLFRAMEALRRRCNANVQAP